MNDIAETFRDTQIRDDVLNNGSMVRFWPISYTPESTHHWLLRNWTFVNFCSCVGNQSTRVHRPSFDFIDPCDVAVIKARLIFEPIQGEAFSGILITFDVRLA